MKIAIKDIKGSNQGELEIPFPLVEDEKGNQAVHDVVVAFRAAQRSGTACAKTRAEVAGSGKKPWRQKGTGRARAGSKRSPLWVGGGVVFGPRPRDYRKKISKSVRKLAFHKCLSERLKASEVTVVEDFQLDQPKTKGVVEIMHALGLPGSLLMVCSQLHENLALAARNIPNLELATSSTVNCYELLRFDHVVVTKSAFDELSARITQN